GGWLLRDRAAADRPAPPRGLDLLFMQGLLALILASCLLRYVLARRAPYVAPERRASAFYPAHVLPAAIIALAAPLRIAYGWWVSPRLEGVLRFWIIPLALGFLFLPRAPALDEFHGPTPGPGASS